MELPERIAAIIKVNQHTPASFADVLGVQRSSISHVLNGRNKPSMDFIMKILEHFPRVDAGWLITGKEPSQNLEQNDFVKASPAPSKSPGSENVKKAVSEEPSKDKRIERIVIFYSDRTFDTYEP